MMRSYGKDGSVVGLSPYKVGEVMAETGHRRLGFDIERFDRDLRSVVSSRGLSLASAARDIGFDSTTLYLMRLRGAVPCGIKLAAICRWSGLDAALYSIDHEAEVGGGAAHADGREHEHS